MRSSPFEVAPEVVISTMLVQSIESHGDWRLRQSGLRPVDTSDRRGERTWTSATWDLPRELVRGPWPRTEDVGRLHRLLRTQFERIRERSER